MAVLTRGGRAGARPALSLEQPGLQGLEEGSQRAPVWHGLPLRSLRVPPARPAGPPRVGAVAGGLPSRAEPGCPPRRPQTPQEGAPGGAGRLQRRCQQLPSPPPLPQGRAAAAGWGWGVIQSLPPPMSSPDCSTPLAHPRRGRTPRGGVSHAGKEGSGAHRPGRPAHGVGGAASPRAPLHGPPPRPPGTLSGGGAPPGPSSPPAPLPAASPRVGNVPCTPSRVKLRTYLFPSM